MRKKLMKSICLLMVLLLAGCVANEDQNDLNDAGVDAENLISENVIDSQQAGLYEGDVSEFLETVTDDMLSACDEVPSYEAFMNEPIVFLNRYDDVYLYGIRTTKQERMILCVQGERVVIDTAWGNLYAEPPRLNYADIDSDGAEEVIISNRTITGNVRQYNLLYVTVKTHGMSIPMMIMCRILKIRLTGSMTMMKKRSQSWIGTETS